jgi:hypothetical protein
MGQRYTEPDATYLSASSAQSISLPIIEKSALLSISTRTPSCSTTSSNLPGFSTYSRWYDKPAQPLFRTPMRISWGVGPFNKPCSRDTALGVWRNGTSRCKDRVNLTRIDGAEAYYGQGRLRRTDLWPWFLGLRNGWRTCSYLRGCCIRREGR